MTLSHKDSIISLIVDEIKTTETGFCNVFHIPDGLLSATNLIKVKILDRLDEPSLELLSSYLKDDIQLIHICNNNMNTIAKTDDPTKILGAIKITYEDLKEVYSGQGGKITSDQLVDFCGMIVKILLVLIISDNFLLDKTLEMAEISIGLVKLTIDVAAPKVGVCVSCF